MVDRLFQEANPVPDQQDKKQELQRRDNDRGKLFKIENQRIYDR